MRYPQQGRWYPAVGPHFAELQTPLSLEQKRMKQRSDALKEQYHPSTLLSCYSGPAPGVFRKFREGVGIWAGS